MDEVRQDFAKYLKACEKDPVFVTRNGKVTAVIEHIEDRDIEDYLLERHPRFRAMLDDVKREGGGNVATRVPEVQGSLGGHAALVRVNPSAAAPGARASRRRSVRPAAGGRP